MLSFIQRLPATVELSSHDSLIPSIAKEAGTFASHIRDSRYFDAEINAHDSLPALLPVYLSNPAFVEQNEGSEGEIGRYDLERWQRDWQIMQMMPGNHRLGCYLKTDLTPVGVLDFLEEDDSGNPWLGTLVIHSAYQRQGLGTETFQCLNHYAQQQMAWTTMRAAVKTANEVGLAFLKHLGFQKIEEGSQQFAGGLQKFYIMEYTAKL